MACKVHKFLKKINDHIIILITFPVCLVFWCGFSVNIFVIPVVFFLFLDASGLRK